MTREEREDVIDIIKSILDKYEEDECLVTDIGIGDEDIKAFKMAIKALEQEPCDCISRQAAQDYIAKYLSQYLYNDVREAVEVIDEYIGDLPSVTPAPKMRHWVHDGGYWKNRWICSECGYKLFDEQTRFCPNCGCAMKGELE